MSEILEHARERLLAPAALNETALERVLGTMLSQSVDYADLYFQQSRAESWVLEDGIVRDGTFSLDRGVGVRATSGEKTGFAYSDELELPALEQAAGAARSIARAGESASMVVPRKTTAPSLYREDDPLASLSDGDKTALLQRVDAAARAMDSRVERVTVSMAGVHEHVLVMGSDGTLGADVRPLVRFNVGVIATENGRRERGQAGGGGRLDYAYFDESRVLGYAQEAVRIALTNLEAVDAPAGSMPVVLGAGWPGVLLHEAVGHGLEGDFNRKGSSAYAGRMGEQVASKLCTIVDDGTMAGRRGSLAIDDEGTLSGYNVLIENGILRGYMQDKHNARLMGTEPTGNGRRESYAALPMPRMTNTYMLGGVHDPQAVIASVDRGLYAVNFGGGQVDITSGKFVFSATEAYMIENGRVTKPVRGATLIGNGPEVMNQVSMVGNDLELDTGVGVCGKDGQSVPVGVGQPTLKIDSVTVGGTAHDD